MDSPQSGSVAPASAAERIDRAIARIEAASARRKAEADALTERHAALRRSMADAVAALDDVLARGGGA